jgi:raffinose/stachyose/melibiose transport system permease protein
MYRYVVLPLLRDSITVSAVLIISGAFIFFTSLAFIMTLGGPTHSTEVLGLRAYLEAFSNLDLGKASAVTVLTMLMTMTLVGIVLFVGSRNRAEY